MKIQPNIMKENQPLGVDILKKFILYGFIIVSVLSVIIRFLIDDGKSEATNIPQPPKKYNIGESVKVGNFKITLDSVRNEEIEKEEGGVLKNYLYCKVTIENIGIDYEHISTLGDFELLDQEGIKYNVKMTINSKGSIDGDIPNGEKFHGELVFDVAKSEKYELIHKDLFTDRKSIWQFDKNNIQTRKEVVKENSQL